MSASFKNRRTLRFLFRIFYVLHVCRDFRQVAPI